MIERVITPRLQRTGEARAPDAIKVADRFNLLHNLTDAAQHALERHFAVKRAIGLDASIPTQRLAKRGSPVARREGETSIRAAKARSECSTHVSEFAHQRAESSSCTDWITDGHHANAQFGRIVAWAHYRS